MKKITDIYNDLDKNIDIKKHYAKKNINTNSKKSQSTNDISYEYKNINLSGKRELILNKNKLKNTDGLIKNQKLKNINIVKKNSFLKQLKSKINFKPSLKDLTYYGNNNKGTIINKNGKILKNKHKINTLLISKRNTLRLSMILLFIFFIGFLNILIIENKINSGYEKILSIKDNSGNIKLIQKTINNAKVDFFIGNILFKPFLLIPNKNVENGYFILQGGKKITTLIDESIYLYISTKDFIDSKGGIENIKLTNLLSNIRKDFGNITTLLYETIVSYDKIDDLGNDNLNKKLFSAKENLKFVYKTLNTIDKDFDIFLSLLGNDKEKKYLILFQNNDEIRATGGFIGSLATVTLKNGKVTSFIKDDVYSYEWDINKNYIERLPAPKGLNRITGHFGLRDSNYFPSFEDSSNSIQFFLKKINKDVDGIIYINQNTILDLLKITGGIKFDKIGETITEENFSLIISTLVEAKSFKIGTLGTPKQILFDFTKLFINQLKEDKQYFKYIDSLVKNIKSRDLVIYSFNSEENNLLWKLGVNGKINYGNSLDFNYPVYTSIGGNKSDRYIKIKYEKNIIVNLDCSISTNLNILRSHTFSKNDKIKINNLLDRYPVINKSREDIMNIQGKGTNVSYTRLLLPKNVIVEPKDGINIKKENNLTVVDFFIETREREVTSNIIKYKLPNPECKPYSYKLYKQPGVKNYSISIKNGDKSIKNKDNIGDFVY